MMVYDNLTKRNMRFTILLNEAELELLRVAIKHLNEDLTLVSPDDMETEDIQIASMSRNIAAKLHMPLVRPREG